MPVSPSPTAAAPLAPILVLTFLASMGTGVFWNAISFVAKHGYGFSEWGSTGLYLAMGVIYMAGAEAAPRLLRGGTPRGWLVVLVAAQGGICALPVVFGAGGAEGAAPAWALWVTCGGVSFASALIWPVVESYVSSGRHGPSMARAIGWFNLTWMVAVAVPLVLMGPFVERWSVWTLGAMTIINLLALPAILRLPAAPGDHDDEAAFGHVPPSYPALLRTSRILLPLSYVLNAALAPILPYRLDVIGAATDWQTPITATWMFVRVVFVFAMFIWAGWRGRSAVLFGGWLALVAGFAGIILAPTLPGMIISFAAFGVGMGVVYYAALYYGLAVGKAGVHASGRHEALIGVGYAIGPTATLAGLGGAQLTAEPGPMQGPFIVAVVGVLVVIASGVALRSLMRRHD